MRRLVLALLAGSLIAQYTILHAAPAETNTSHSTNTNRSKGVAAFQAIVPVLRHPRCIVCHATGDYPRQGDDLHRHIMDVRRGPDGMGTAPVQCSTCHQDHNLQGAHMPPGAPGWRQPPSNNRMIWEGLTNRQLCELMADPKRNGGRDAKGIEEHMHTPLVLWGWNPGEGRTPVPMPEKVFLEEVHVWTSAGTPCPR